MSALKTDFNLGPEADALYAEIVAAHDRLSEAESARLNARLVLLLANHIGDPVVIRAALATATAGLDSTET